MPEEPDLSKYEVKPGELDRYEQPQTSVVDRLQSGEAGGASVVDRVLQSGKEALQGVGAGVLHTTAGTSRLLNKIPVVGEALAPSSGIKAMQDLETPPPTIPGKVGYFGEQAGEFLLPGDAESVGAAKLGTKLPMLGRAAGPVARIAGAGLSSGLVNKVQGGGFGTGALTGAGLGAIGEGAKAIAPAVAETALRVTGPMRMRGRTIGPTLVNDLEGIRPATISQEAGNRVTELTSDMENAIHEATEEGTKSTNSPAHQVLTQEINSTPRNARDLRAKLEGLRDILDLQKVKKPIAQAGFTAGPPTGEVKRQFVHTPDEILELKRGIDKEIKTWRPEWQKSEDVQRVKQRLYGALDAELDKAVPTNAATNQKISTLIPVRDRALEVAHQAPIVQSTMGRIARPTGALVGGALGSEEGYRHGGIPGAIAGGAAGLVIPEIISSPSVQMLGARVLNSGVPAKITRAAALQLDRKNKSSKE